MNNEFILQFHISDQCNLRCKHCYQENYNSKQLKYEEIIKILDQYKEFLIEKNIKGHINLTGGEPLSNPNFFEILNYIDNNKEYYSFAILTNGTLITDKIAEKISKYKPQYVQISIDGDKKTHEKIRGKGTLEKAIQGVQNLNKYGVYTSISFTAHKKNYKTFKKVVSIAKKARANKVWTDRLIPIGGAKELVKISLNQKENKKFFKTVYKLMIKTKETQVTMSRALQFLQTGEIPYKCTAGTKLLTVMENGDLVPCRRMPIVLGNVLKENLLEIYKKSNAIKQLEREEIPKECIKCEHSEKCRGGLKCLTYAMTEKIIGKDPGCYYL